VILQVDGADHEQVGVGILLAGPGNLQRVKLLLDGLDIATELGNARAVNSVLLGVLASYCTLPVECWEQALRTAVKARFIDLNLAAFQRGRALASAAARS
jgi:Pyruvate/2-oxoacid:ferredoxin oxidoreductase gamma subunit